MPPSESRPDAAIGIAGLTPPSESCGNRSRFPPVAVHARVIVCVLYRPATVVFRVSGEYPMSLSRFGIVGLVLAAGLGLSACASDGYYGGASLGYGGYYGDPYYTHYFDGSGSGDAPSFYGWYGCYFSPATRSSLFGPLGTGTVRGGG